MPSSDKQRKLKVFFYTFVHFISRSLYTYRRRYITTLTTATTFRQASECMLIQVDPYWSMSEHSWNVHLLCLCVCAVWPMLLRQWRQFYLFAHWSVKTDKNNIDLICPIQITQWAKFGPLADNWPHLCVPVIMRLACFSWANKRTRLALVALVEYLSPTDSNVISRGGENSEAFVRILAREGAERRKKGHTRSLLWTDAHFYDHSLSSLIGWALFGSVLFGSDGLARFELAWIGLDCVGSSGSDWLVVPVGTNNQRHTNVTQLLLFAGRGLI